MRHQHNVTCYLGKSCNCHRSNRILQNEASSSTKSSESSYSFGKQDPGDQLRGASQLPNSSTSKVLSWQRAQQLSKRWKRLLQLLLLQSSQVIPKAEPPKNCQLLHLHRSLTLQICTVFQPLDPCQTTKPRNLAGFVLCKSQGMHVCTCAGLHKTMHMRVCAYADLCRTVTHGCRTVPSACGCCPL